MKYNFALSHVMRYYAFMHARDVRYASRTNTAAAATVSWLHSEKQSACDQNDDDDDVKASFH